MSPRVVFGQSEVYGWGGFRGIRVGGQLVAFTSGVRGVTSDPATIPQFGNEHQTNSQFSRDGNKQIVSGGLPFALPATRSTTGASSQPAAGRGRGRGRGANALTCRQTFEDVAPGVVNVDVQITANAAVAMKGIYFFLHLPEPDFQPASTQTFQEFSQLTPADLTPLPATQPAGENYFQTAMVSGLRLGDEHHRVQLFFKSQTQVILSENRVRGNKQLNVYFPITTGDLAAGATAHINFTISAQTDVDKSPVNLVIDPSNPGSPFDGIGGNFRLQGPADPAHLQYNLENLRVAWGRVAMPLDRWQPTQDVDPTVAATAGNLNTSVRQTMEMARTLAQKNIPIIISDWQAPQWALLPSDGKAPPPGLGRRIDPQKWDDLCKAIGSYLVYLKQNYAVEPRLFSFNESDLGINVWQSPQEHADAIKRLGADFAARGLKTKMLLGDVSDPTPVDFINIAMQDPQAIPWIAAVSFHSWRGGTDEQFTRWGNAARQLHVPLIVGEGGTDADAYRYPAIFLEPWYALDEISEYLNICRICQPLSILQWQLTENYSVLTGGSNGEPLKPAQRFWQLKQLGNTPIGSAALPITCDKPNIASCAYLQTDHGALTVHLTNTGATRPAVLSGLPPDTKQLWIYVTDRDRALKDMGAVEVTAGSAHFTMDSMSLITLSSERWTPGHP